MATLVDGSMPPARRSARSGESDWLRARSRLAIMTVAAVLTLWTGLLGGVVDPSVRLELLYVIPIAGVTWLAGFWSGLAFSVGCAALSLLVELMTGGHGLVLLSNILIQLTVFLVVVLTVTSIRRAFEREKELALHDPLTGAANRRLFRAEAERELARCQRYSHPFTVAVLDLDNFKQVNDTQGHEAGDAILRLVAEGIRGSLRATDIYARLGGDEFALLLPETDHHAASAVLRKVQHHISLVRTPAVSRVTATIGAVTYEEPPSSVDEVLIEADRVMYSIRKHEGKNAVGIAYERSPLDRISARNTEFAESI